MAKAKKFGAFGGVFAPSILSILGVIMFLRLPWIVGQAGLWSTLGIIFVAHIISVSTGLSVSSIATDKRVGTGGSYYILSRSLGLPIGGTLGLALFVGLSFSVSLYLIGFSETVLTYFGLEFSLQNIRIVGSIVLFLVAGITFLSTSLAIKSQYLIMGILVLSLASVFLGRHEFIPGSTLLLPASGSLPWITLFAIFFPAVTGFQAGVSMSGDLKDPKKQIPFGTISAILFGLVVYVALAVFFSFTIERDLLLNDPNVLFTTSLVPQLVIAGILSATLSSALGSILAAPRILKSMAIDRIMPEFLSKGFGLSNEPRNALLITYLIAQAGILIGELNAIARIVSIFFIIIYGFLNITYAVENWAGTDFRPSFKIPKIIAVIGALACIIVMIQLDVIALIVASLVLIALFLFLKKKELTLQTDDTWNSIWTSLVKTGLGKLTISSRKPSNWRPNVILFSGGEKSRPHLIDMGKSLVGKLGIFTNFELIEEPMTGNLHKKSQEHLVQKEALKAGVFTRYHECRDVYEGMDVISKIYGFSGFEPNTILMGWAKNTRNPENFFALLKSFKAQDYNTVFLNYVKEHGFGNYQQIDVWWSGKGRNLSLAVTLLRFITSSKEWRGARIRVLTICKDSSLTDSLYGLVNQVLDNERIRASVKVINNGVEQLPESDIMHAESQDTDLCMLELPDFDKADPASLIDKVNHLTQNLNTCLVVSASSFFDEMGIKELKLRKGISGAIPITEKPVPDIVQHIIPASKEIIANEVNNIGHTAESLTEQYYTTGFQTILDKQLEFFPEIHFFAGKVFDNLLEVAENKNQAGRSKALLKLLNDFSFHSQKQIQKLKDQIVPFERACLEHGNDMYLRGLQNSLSEVPERLRVKRPGSDFKIEKDDRLFTRTYKIRKKLISLVSGKAVSHRINLLPAVRYFIYHKRLELLETMMNDFAVHSFQQVTEIRKILISLHESIERVRIAASEKQNVSGHIRLEKQRILAKVGVMEDDSKTFFYTSGKLLYQSLLEDLNSLGQHLDTVKANLLSKKFSVHLRRAPQIADNIQGFAGIWQNNLLLFTNKAALDFSVLGLKSRINSKIQKAQKEFRVSVKNTLLSAIDNYKALSQDEAAGPRELHAQFEQLDHTGLEAPSANRFFEALFEEIAELLKDVPEKVEIGGDQFAERPAGVDFPEAEPVVINFKKILSNYLGSKLIDASRKLSLETDQQLQRVIVSIKDQVRLINFGLSADEGIDAEHDVSRRAEQRSFLINNFTNKLKDEERKVNKQLDYLEQQFGALLIAAFDPLSSATISNTDTRFKGHHREKGSNVLFIQINKQWQHTLDFFRKHFVALLYSKSEGMIWFRLLEKPTASQQLMTGEALDFVESISPSPEIIKELPFYYCSLFSGQAGIGDDFWVGMKDEIREADKAIRRFKAGYSGALVVTGVRSSGKSSLAKMMIKKHFKSENIHHVRAPQGCSANLELFQSRLYESLGVSKVMVDDLFRALPQGKVILIQDLAMWWERRPDGDAVIEFVKDLIDKYGDKCLFVITVNSHALSLIDHWSQINNYALSVVNCEPFDARELKEMILLRHHAGGLRLQYKNKDEEKMTAWDYARLFNTFFDHSFGNPGTAISLWLAAIKKVSGKTIYMEPFSLSSQLVFDKLSQDQWFYILQFILHRRFSIDTLAKNVEQDNEKVYSGIRELMRAGILVEKFPDIYAIRPGLDLFLIDKLKSLKRL